MLGNTEKSFHNRRTHGKSGMAIFGATGAFMYAAITADCGIVGVSGCQNTIETGEPHYEYFLVATVSGGG